MAFSSSGNKAAIEPDVAKKYCHYSYLTPPFPQEPPKGPHQKSVVHVCQVLSFIQNEHDAIFVRWNEAAKETAKFNANPSQVRVALRASEKIIVAMILVRWL